MIVNFSNFLLQYHLHHIIIIIIVYIIMIEMLLRTTFISLFLSKIKVWTQTDKPQHK